MALKRNMTRDEMISFIDSELLPQAELEIGNWTIPHKKQGGYFVVTRQILCMVDFLGATYSGYHLAERKKDQKEHKERIATTQKAKKFIADFFEPQNTYTNSTINYLYSIYRHGLVHLYQPRILRYNSKRKLQWYFYKGNKRFYKTQSVNTPIGKKTFHNVSHLQVLKNPSEKHYYFPIGIDCLYEDFVEAVRRYKSKLEKTKYLQTNWRTSVNAICKPR